MLLRTREETPEEIIGFTEACRDQLPHKVKTLNADLDIGCYAGKRRQLPWYLLSVAVLAQNDVRVFLHGAHEPGSGRLYASQVLPELGLPSVNSIDAALIQLEQFQVTYLDLGFVLPSLDRLIKLREEFGLRSCANTLGRLLNPSYARFSIQGVFHEHLDHKHAVANEAFHTYQALCFRGDGGDPEVNGERPTNLLITKEGTTKKVILPGQTERWALKESRMTAQTLLDFWQGITPHAYGEQSVIATLTAYLSFYKAMSLDKAKQRALRLWKHRNKQALPFLSN